MSEHGQGRYSRFMSKYNLIHNTMDMKVFLFEHVIVIVF